MADQSRTFAYVGCYTRTEPYPRGRSDGINVYRLEPSGDLSHVQVATGALNPTFLALDPARRHLYAVNAVPDIDGHEGGAVTAYAIDPASGGLTYVNRQSSIGKGPAHVAVDTTGSLVVVSNYASGSVAVLPIRPDGSLGEASDFHQHVGSSVNLKRQEGPHAHSASFDPTNRFALICDLGLDKVMVYRLDLAQGKLVPNDAPWVEARPGSGPRHLAFHPDGKHVYVINELDSTISTFEWDGARGSLREIAAISTLPADYHGANTTAEVRVSASGRFVYGSNRGHDSVAVFAVDGQTGLLTNVGFEPSGGKTPRNFTFDPSESRLFAANQDSDSIVTFRIDHATGRLTPTGQVTQSPSPVCVRIVDLAR